MKERGLGIRVRFQKRSEVKDGDFLFISSAKIIVGKEGRDDTWMTEYTAYIRYEGF